MEYTLTLSDGTRVYLNAESRLKYPVVFRGTERVVELSGEAYFKVSKDALRPFVVKMNGVNVRVLGTSFNVRSYADEGQVVTTLVEGKVKVNDQDIVEEITLRLVVDESISQTNLEELINEFKSNKRESLL